VVFRRGIEGGVLFTLTGEGSQRPGGAFKLFLLKYSIIFWAGTITVPVIKCQAENLWACYIYSQIYTYSEWFLLSASFPRKKTNNKNRMNNNENIILMNEMLLIEKIIIRKIRNKTNIKKEPNAVIRS